LEAKKYVEEIKKIKPKYLVYSDSSSTYKKYMNCTTKLYKSGRKIASIATRNPFNQNKQKFDVYIYEINTDLLPECINPNKVSPYSRE
jgi:hypothetical protein